MKISPTLRTALGAIVLVTSRPIDDARAQSVEVTFQARDSAHAEALEEYREIWQVDGQRILRALEAASTWTFPVDAIRVDLIDGASWAGTDRIGMRATYPTDTKRATLSHELGHIVIGDNIPVGADGRPVADHHAVLFLFLYDVWTDLWGEDFARAQVVVESNRRGLVDYEGLWEVALAMTRAERVAEFARLRGEWTAR